MAENVKNTFFNPASALYEEPENLLKQEVREPALYNAIISAIASGASGTYTVPLMQNAPDGWDGRIQITCYMVNAGKNISAVVKKNGIK